MAFTPYNHELGTLELSKKLGIHKSTTSRLLHVLTAHGFLKQNPDTRKYFLGRMASELGNAVARSLNNTIVTLAQPYLTELSERVGESVALELLAGNKIILAAHVESQGHIRFSFRLGEQVPINVAAGAKSILAFSAGEFVDSCLKPKFMRFNANTIVSKRKYRALLKEVRETGIAYDRGERFEDSYAMATPVFNHENVPVAAVVIAGPAFRMTDQFLRDTAAPLKKTAADIARRLFY